MKLKQQILLFATLWGLNPLVFLPSELSSVQLKNLKKEIAKQEQFPCNFLNCYSQKEQSNNKPKPEPPVRRTPNSDGYRPSPPSKYIPHIITPKEGIEIYSSTPILRWQPVKNVVEYTIKIDGLGVEKTLYSNGEDWFIRYESPELQAGEEYIVTVSANNGRESSEVRFKMVDREKAQKIEAKISQLQQTISDRDERDLQIAQVYRDEGLLVDAIDTLEILIDRKTQITEAYCLLSTLYQEIDSEAFSFSLDRLAEGWKSRCESRESTLE